MASKLTFRARTLDVAKPLAIYRAEDLPELAADHAINRAVPALPTGMEKEEETEKHLQDILEAQNKGLVKKVAELVIPTPEVMEDTEPLYDALYKSSFKQTRQYIHVQPFSAADQDKPDYDMDEEDIRFFNEDLRDRRKFEVSMITFEDMIDRLEKNSGQTVVSLKEAKMLLKEDDDLILAVYDYWLNKRLETQQCLIPTVKSEPCRGGGGDASSGGGQTAAANPYIAFRRRTEKMQTRKNRKNEEDSYVRMLKLRRDINRAVMLLDLVKRREKLKKEHLNLIADVLEKRFQAEDWDGALYQQVQAQKTTTTSRVLQANYPLASWINAAAAVAGGGGSPQEPALLPLKREKRVYRKRKHHRSGLLLRNGLTAAAGFFKTGNGLNGGSLGGGVSYLSAGLSDGLLLSSDDEHGSSSLGGGGSGRLSDAEADEATATDYDNPFAFRRKAGVQYLAPVESMQADLGRLDDAAMACDMTATYQRGGGGPAFLPAMAPLTLSRAAESLGLCRRRLGRGGRVIIDRIPSRWSGGGGSWWSASVGDPTNVERKGEEEEKEEEMMAVDWTSVVRPLTPPQFQLQDWDPYRVPACEGEVLAV
jgi:enhancer of polycomb-like protein